MRSYLHRSFTELAELVKHCVLAFLALAATLTVMHSLQETSLFFNWLAEERNTRRVQQARLAWDSRPATFVDGCGPREWVWEDLNGSGVGSKFDCKVIWDVNICPPKHVEMCVQKHGGYELCCQAVHATSAANELYHRSWSVQAFERCTDALSECMCTDCLPRLLMRLHHMWQQLQQHVLWYVAASPVCVIVTYHRTRLFETLCLFIFFSWHAMQSQAAILDGQARDLRQMSGRLLRLCGRRFLQEVLALIARALPYLRE